jgi:hypothetical protein
MNGQPTEIVTEVQLDFSLRPRPPASDVGEIQGQIRHVDGSSAAIMPVAAVLLSESGSRSTTFVARTVTDQSGAYRFSAIPPGRYHIEAGSTSPTYFPGTTNIREAAAVLMPDRANLIGMNVTMSRPVRVKARFAGGISSAALSAMKVVLTPIEVLLISNEAVAGNDGTFEFDDVLPGTYMISLFAGEPLSAAIRGTGGILEVGGSDSNELLRNPGAFVIRVQRRGGAVAGRVAREPAGQFPGLEFEIEAISLAPAANSDREKLVLSTRADGSFSLPLTQGTWLVYFSDLKGYSLQSISYGATDLLKEPLQVPATPAAEIRVNLQR